MILGKPTFISTNGGINTYLGQAHLLRVYNANKYGISYFANNNYFYDKTLIKEETFDFPVWEQEKFFSMVEKLWQENPIRQLKISIKNASDLFLIVPHWPIRDTGEYKKLDISAQWAFLFLVYLPSLLTLILSFRNKGFLTEILILFAFIFGAVIIAAITKGEERYMVPFQYVFILLAAPFWEKTLQFLCFSLRIKSRKSLG